MLGEGFMFAMLRKEKQGNQDAVGGIHVSYVKERKARES